MKKILIKLNIWSFGLFLGLKSVSAQATSVENPGAFSSLEELLDIVTFWMVMFSIPIVSIMILWGAFLMVTSAGEPGKIQKGKDTIKYAVFGFVAVLVARGAGLIIKEIIGV